jgi:hypothetical protein
MKHSWSKRLIARIKRVFTPFADNLLLGLMRENKGTGNVTSGLAAGSSRTQSMELEIRPVSSVLGLGAATDTSGNLKRRRKIPLRNKGLETFALSRAIPSPTWRLSAFQLHAAGHLSVKTHS